jgi:uncharacterized BrkB/YihY/UPF0761 family membrane protein
MDDEQAHRAPNRQSFAADMMTLGPASTPGRELIAAVLQIGAVALLIFVVFPDRLPELWRWALVGATAVYFLFRVLAGIPKWRRR